MNQESHRDRDARFSFSRARAPARMSVSAYTVGWCHCSRRTDQHRIPGVEDMDMTRRCRTFVTVLALVAAITGVTLIAGQSQAPASKTKPSAGSWTARTAWGDPDLQGKWLVAETV